MFSFPKKKLCFKKIIRKSTWCKVSYVDVGFMKPDNDEFDFFFFNVNI